MCRSSRTGWERHCDIIPNCHCGDSVAIVVFVCVSVSVYNQKEAGIEMVCISALPLLVRINKKLGFFFVRFTYKLTGKNVDFFRLIDSVTNVMYVFVLFIFLCLVESGAKKVVIIIIRQPSCECCHSLHHINETELVSGAGCSKRCE